MMKQVLISLSKNLFSLFIQRIWRSSKEIEWKFHLKVVKENRNKVAILLLYFFYFHLPDPDGCGCKTHGTLLIIFRHDSGTELNTRKVYTKFPRDTLPLQPQEMFVFHKANFKQKDSEKLILCFFFAAFSYLPEKVFKP